MSLLLDSLLYRQPLPAWAPPPAPSPVGSTVRFTASAPPRLQGLTGICMAEHADGSFRIDRYCPALNRRESVTASARDFTLQPLPRGEYPTAKWPAGLTLLAPVAGVAA